LPVDPCDDAAVAACGVPPHRRFRRRGLLLGSRLDRDVYKSGDLADPGFSSLIFATHEALSLASFADIPIAPVPRTVTGMTVIVPRSSSGFDPPGSAAICRAPLTDQLPSTLSWMVCWGWVT
jgi:hypothetical protein